MSAVDSIVNMSISCLSWCFWGKYYSFEVKSPLPRAYRLCLSVCLFICLCVCVSGSYPRRYTGNYTPKIVLQCSWNGHFSHWYPRLWPAFLMC